MFPKPLVISVTPQQWADIIIAGVQVFIAFVKFGIYHYWVFPQTHHPAGEGEAERAPNLPAQ
jgi:hypothetical protein